MVYILNRISIVIFLPSKSFYVLPMRFCYTLLHYASIFFSLPGAAGAQSGKQCSTSSSCKLFVETENDCAYTVSSSSAFASACDWVPHADVRGARQPDFQCTCFQRVPAPGTIVSPEWVKRSLERSSTKFHSLSSPRA